MKITRGKLGFDIPVQIPNKETTVAMTPEAITAWRAQLNLADTGESAKQIYTTLNDANQVTIPAATRAQILELFKNPVRQLCTALKKHYIIEASILSPQKLAIANLAQMLQLEMTYGYKLIIEELGQSKGDNNTRIAEAILNSMNYFTLVLMHCYQLYSAEPKNLWREIHLLYKLAEAHNLLKYNGNITTADKKANPSIITTYKHALLLAATNPYQWRQSEQEVINNVLNLWAPYTNIVPYSTNFIGKPSIFILHLDQDLPPVSLGINTIPESNNSILLELKQVVVHLKELIDTMANNEINARIAHEGDPEYAISSTTLNRLVKNWSAYIARKNNRYKVSGGMQLVFGLYAVHYYLSDEQSFDQKISTAKTASGDNPSAPTSSHNVALPTFDAFEDESSFTAPVATSQDKPASSEFPIYKCTMLDVSPTGARVAIDEHSHPPVQAGEIITMRPDYSQDRTYWNVGVVRWIKYSSEGNLHVGIQILAPSGIAAAAQILKDNVGSGYFLRCLLLPAMPDMDTKATLITPTIPFKKNRSILMYTDDPSKLIKTTLTSEVDSSSSYKQFEYSTPESVAAPQANGQNLATGATANAVSNATAETNNPAAQNKDTKKDDNKPSDEKFSLEDL